MGGKTSAKAKNAWIAKAYDRINLTVPKGQKETIQSAAAACGESVNGFIGKAIAQRLEREASGVQSVDTPVSPEEIEWDGSGFSPGEPGDILDSRFVSQSRPDSEPTDPDDSPDIPAPL